MFDELEKRVERLRIAALEYQYSETVFRVTERIEVWLATKALLRHVKKMDRNLRKRVEIIEPGGEDGA